MTDDKTRRRAERMGATAEWWAATRLRLKGYRILARNWTSPMGELDIIAVKSGVLVVIEVKYRTEYDMHSALSSISQNKQTRIRNGTRHFLSRHQKFATIQTRFDVIVLSGGLWGWPQHRLHIKDAFM